MNLRKFSVFALYLGMVFTLQAQTLTVKEKPFASYEPYANFFGFSDTEAYMKFAQSMEKLRSQQLRSEVDIWALPQVKKALNDNYQTLGSEEKSELSVVVNQRQRELADLLGVTVKDLLPLMNKYLDFAELQESLHQIEQSKNKDLYSSAEDDEEIERITVNGQLLFSWGGYGSIMMGIGLAELAGTRGISQYQEFEVVFIERQTVQTFMYNNFSGAWARSSERELLPNEHIGIE
ncbi:hypothetical protein E0Z06_02860 [Rheinheimera sp. D18]|uniref:hypothetical protein n=1 Tax=Rheinheimera sp. D18 TaxID=2545632 RepID=UPI0010522DED|nr:hypothetical protein [Rheinheimera sp. D18]QBL08529.1 hypothetical protein E0Z06_02860 [Rheinheimera sp. D18]